MHHRTATSAFLVLLLLGGMTSLPGHAQLPDPAPFADVPADVLEPELPELPMQFSFEKNLGQWNPEARYLARGIGYDAFLATDKLVMDFARPEASALATGAEFPPQSPADVEHLAVMMHFDGANPSVTFAEEGLTEETTNYFLNNDETQWVRDAPHFTRIVYDEIYPGIDLAFYQAHQGGLKYDFIVAPGADAGAIQLRFEGVDSVAVEPDGRLALHTPFGVLHQDVPTTYQVLDDQTLPVANQYAVDGALVRFEVAEYDSSLPLVIDPLIVGTYIGGSGDDIVNDVAVDPSGYIWLVGYTQSTNYPTTPYVYRTSGGASVDSFVSKLDTTGTVLDRSSYFGTNSGDYAMSVAYENGIIWATGYTFSLFQWPTTSDAYQRVSGGGGDGFLIGFYSTLNMIYGSTLFGGAGDDYPYDMSGTSSTFKVAGFTTSLNFPEAQWGRQKTHGGGTYDGFVASIHYQLMGQSTYLGGSGDDYASRVHYVPGATYVGGYTNSANFPTTAGVHRTTLAGGNDAFVAKVMSVSTADWVTLVGGSLNDQITLGGVWPDSSGNVYIAGSTASTNFPTTSGAYDTLLAGTTDAFVAKLNPTATALLFSSYLGGLGGEYARGLVLDSGGNPVILLGSDSANFPITGGANRTTNAGTTDIVVAKMNNAGSQLQYASYMGGTGIESPMGLALDSSNAAYIAGYTTSTNYPVTAGAFRTSNAGAKDGFATKMTLVPDPPNPPVNFGYACPATYGVILSWQAPGYTAGVPITKYRVYRSDDGGTTWSLRSEPTGTTYTEMPATWGTYGYRVSAVSQYGEGLPASLNWVQVCDQVPPSCTATGYLVDWTRILPTLTGATCTDAYAGLASAAACTNVWPQTCNYKSLYGTPDYGTFGPWSPSITLTSLPQGTNTLTFKAYDRDGEVYTQNNVWTVKYDSLGPVMSIVSSTHLDQLLYYATTTLSATVSATDSGIGVKGVYWYLTTSDTCPSNITGVGTYTAGSSAALTQPVPGVFEIWSLCAQGVDLLDNVGAVKRYAVNVDTGLPTPGAFTGQVTPNGAFLAHYDEMDGGLDPGELTRIDLSSVVLKIDGVDIGATYGTACPPNGAVCQYEKTPGGVRWDPPGTFAPNPHNFEVTAKDTTVEQNVKVWGGTFTVSTL